MYVATWFYIATIVTVTMLHVVNLTLPLTIAGSGSDGTVPRAGPDEVWPVYAGVQDAVHAVVVRAQRRGVFLTTPVPRADVLTSCPRPRNAPLYSYRLSIVHFWSLVFIYIWAGPHHLHYTALPQWASTLGMLFSVMLWMPSWGGGINGLLTLRGAWHKVTGTRSSSSSSWASRST